MIVLTFDRCVRPSIIEYLFWKVFPTQDTVKDDEVSVASVESCFRCDDDIDSLAGPIKESPAFRQFVGRDDAFRTEVPPFISGLILHFGGSPVFFLVQEEVLVAGLYFDDGRAKAVEPPYVGVFSGIGIEFDGNIQASPARVAVLVPKSRTLAAVGFLPFMKPLCTFLTKSVVQAVCLAH